MTGSWTVHDAARVLRRPTPSDDKYSRGVLGVRTGSDAYPGAAVLGVEAAWRTGVGMVRYVGPAVPSSLVLQRRPETVTVEGRVQAWLIGSGTDAAARSDAETQALRGILGAALPVVCDAGALDLAPGATAPLVVTPHGREHARLRALVGLSEDAPTTDAARAASAEETAAALGATVVLKGFTTVVAAPGGWSTTVAAGTPWLATAGTGDVLAAAIGAVVAGATAVEPPEPDDLARLAATGVWLHGRAASLAAGDLGPAGGPITAADVAAALPRAVAEAIAAR
jgi:NAD(P)H-hydrate repair Nnr-like enzyme with NAD(P)H-hydrate dehydratase domain